MIKGILIFEQGGMQQIGELSSLQGIINTIKQALPELEAQEAKRVIEQISDEDLLRIVEVRKNAKEAKPVTGETEKLK